MSDIKPGDIVRVKDPNAFTSVFAAKVKDRDAIVDRFGTMGFFKSYVYVTFQKRNGRGKEFTERIHMRDLVKVDAASNENGQRGSEA